MSKNIQKGLIAGVSVLALFAGCGGYDNDNKNVVGADKYISAEIIEDISPEQMTAILDAAGKPHGDFVFGYKAIKLKYKTTNEKSQSVDASGLLVLPVTTPEFLAGYEALNDRNFSVSMVSDQHGTIFPNSQAPSVAEIKNGLPESDLGALFSSIYGFATLMPDYIGYGDSVSNYHPFILEKSSANATVDFIKAAIKYCNDNQVPLNGQLFLSGYSEGGYATMAAAKEIELNQNTLSIKASAPMAGPYDLEKMTTGVLNAPMMAFPPFLAYIVDSYAKTYDDINVSGIINAPYASMLDSLFDREHNATQIYGSLPNVFNGGQEPDKLFVPDYSDDFIANEDNALRKRFVENSPINWTPKNPMNLYHCTNDLVIPYAMSELAHASFVALGSTSVTLKPIESVESNASNPTQVHGNCAGVIYPQVAAWFDAVRKGE